jgi:hypothetical protein
MTNEAVMNDAIETDVATDAADVQSDQSFETENLDDGSDAADDDGDQGEQRKKSDLPENVKKAMEKKNRYTKNLLRRNKELQSQLDAFKSKAPKETAAPSEEQFENYGEFLKAQMKHELQKELEAQSHKQQEGAFEQQKAMIRQQQDQMMAEELTQLVQTNDEAKRVLTAPENLQAIDSMPDAIADLFYEVENPVVAAYALAKEGKLERLSYMNPYMAAAEILAAQDRGLQYLSQGGAPARQAQMTQTKQPPQPIGSLKGAGSSKTISAKSSPDAIVKWLEQ